MCRASVCVRTTAGCTTAFGGRPDRLFLVGAVGAGSCDDLDAATALDWIADHGFRATTLPGSPRIPATRRCSTHGGSRTAAPTSASHCGSTAVTATPRGCWAPKSTDTVRQFEASGHDIERFWEILVTSVFNGELLDAPFPRRRCGS